MNIEKRKRKLVDAYGDAPTVSFYYYTWNVVDYAGEKRVRESFESIAEQGDEVVIGMYAPQDSTASIAEEYAIKPMLVKKESKDIWDFPESKVRNKVIINTDCNYVIALNINVVYDSNLGKRVKRWISKNSVLDKMLRIRYRYHGKDGDKNKQYGKSQVFYRPYLLEARGYDERTGYATGSQRYAGLLMRRVFKLQKINWDTKMVHKYHNQIKTQALQDMTLHRSGARKLTDRLHAAFQEDFDTTVKYIRNSYW